MIELRKSSRPEHPCGTGAFGVWRKAKLFGICAVLLLVGFGIRFHNLTEVLVAGRFYFVDADCYSRMSRAQIVSQNPGTVVHHQDFENWPEGVDSHATAPLDYAIVGFERLLRWTWPESGRLAVLKNSTLDLAGALISPLIGLLACGFLGVWAAGFSPKSNHWRWPWWAVPLLASVSPPLVHATVFGRPDHQSLLVLFLAIALGAEQRLQSSASSRWAWLGGGAWGMALWVSLYEPAVLLGAVFLLGLWFWRSSWSSRYRLKWAAAMLLFLVCAWMVDGFHVALPQAQWQDALKAWGSTIGELQKAGDVGVLRHWTGELYFVAPLGMLWVSRGKSRETLGWFILLLLGSLLVCWQIRWSPFFVLIFILCLPMILSPMSSYWAMSLVFGISLWPLIQDWERRLFPDAPTIEARYMERSERINARLAAERMRSSERQPFLAVWWHSPALAYWSGQPAIAGSGHEGISGIVDTARFFLATDPAEAREILVRRGVRVVVASDSARAVENSTAILGRTIVQGKPLAEKLWQSELGDTWGLDGEGNVTTFRLLRVRGELR